MGTMRSLRSRAKARSAEFPVVPVGTEKGAVQRRAVAQEIDAHFPDQREIGFPML